MSGRSYLRVPVKEVIMDIIVIGGIAAGMSVAAKARRENPDATITVIEKEDYVSFGACGLPYYLGNQFDDENEMFARTPEQMEQSGINLLLKHEVESVDFENKRCWVLNLETNEKIEKTYDRLMIASGARAVLPPLEGIHSENVYTITRLNSVNRLKDNLDTYKNIVIVGGGFIGVEVAEQLSQFNKNITLIHSRDVLMNGVFDKEFGEKMVESLEEVGVNVKLDQRAQALTVVDNKATEVITPKGVYEADVVIFATGFKPNTEFLENKLETLQNGAIVTDEYGQTSIKDVFAAGDCAAVEHKLAGTLYIPLATYANKMGRLIGTNIATVKEDWIAFNGALGSSYIKVGHNEAATTGLTEDLAKKLGLNVKSTTVFANNHSNYYPNQEKIMIKLIYDEDTFVLYGAQVFGKAEAVLRIQALTVAIHAGVTTKDLAFMDFGYAPPFASTWEALNIAANTAK